MNWRRAIEHLNIGESVQADGIAVGRISRNRYVVMMDGEVTSVGGGGYRVNLVVNRVANYVTGEHHADPCADCNQPRECLSYCRTHYNERHAEWARRMRHP